MAKLQCNKINDHIPIYISHISTPKNLRKHRTIKRRIHTTTQFRRSINPMFKRNVKFVRSSFKHGHISFYCFLSDSLSFFILDCSTPIVAYLLSVVRGFSCVNSFSHSSEASKNLFFERV